MALIETDIILAVSSPNDKRHGEARSALRGLRGRAALSPYALIELDLLLLSGRLRVADAAAFYDALKDALAYYWLDVLAPSPDHLARARELRREHGLTYFDSLHAAAALASGEEIVSYDPVYDRVPGLKRVHPSRYARPARP